MGIEIIKDQKGEEHLAYDYENSNDDTMGDKPEDFEILQILNKDIFGYEMKVYSLINNKIYAMKEIDLTKLEKEEYLSCINEIKILKKINHKYQIKYYKSFEKNNKLYIIKEFFDNGNLQEFIQFHITKKIPIEENDIWNFALQIAEYLKYLHSIKKSHLDIRPRNIFLTDEKTIIVSHFNLPTLIKKTISYLNINTNILGSVKKDLNKIVEEIPLYMSPEMISQINNNISADIYSMGVILYELCYFQLPYAPTPGIDDNGNLTMIYVPIKKNSNNKYSKELNEILEKMLEKDPQKRISIEQLYEFIKKEYIKKCVQNSSIDAVVRCLSSFKNLTFKYLQELNNIIKNNEKQNIISFIFLNCLENIRDNKDLNIFLYELREKFIENNKILENKEIDINLILNFILEKLHQEFSKNSGQQDIPSIGLQIENNSDINKNNCIKKYQDYKNKYFNSCISELFLTDIKTKRICSNDQCKLGTYSFKMFNFIKFNLNLCLKESNNIDQWFDIQNNKCAELYNYCYNCKKYQTHYEFKQFFKTAKNLVISIYRGDNYENKTPIIFNSILSIGKFVEDKNSSKNYKLVGILKRRDGVDKENYIGLYLDSFTNCWKECNKNKVIDCPDPLSHSFGYVMMLFYTSE